MYHGEVFVRLNRTETVKKEEYMETEKKTDIRKRVKLFKNLRWVGGVFGIIMYLATENVFGEMMAIMLCLAATLGFYHICDGESRRTMCQFVADDLKAAVTAAGHSRCVVEIRSMSAGLITRVYLIGAGGLAARYNRAVLERINRSWYRKDIWVTQILELEHENELEEAHEFLDERLIDDIRQMRGEKWNQDNRDDGRKGQ